MPEPEVTAPAEAEKPVAPSTPKIDPTKPLSSQVGALNKIADSIPEKKENVSTEEVSEEKQEQEKTEEQEETTHLVEDDDDDEPEKPTPELGTWQKYVFDNLPSITARILDKNGKEKTVQVKTDAELPAGFSFADDAARSQFSRDIASQEVKAQKLLDDFRKKELDKQLKEFEQQESIDVSNAVTRLQKQGILGKFDDSTPNTDPAVKQANEIYDLYKKVNAEYAEKYGGTNRMFRISYEDAAYRYFAMKARESKSAPPKPDKKEEPKKTPIQKEREEVASHSGGGQGADAETGGKLRARPGMTMNDINRLFRQGRI